MLDYRVSYDRGVNNWQVLADGVTQTTYTTPVLTSGTTYAFKIEARNAVGYSTYSTQTSVLCATIPDVADAPSTVVTGNSV